MYSFPWGIIATSIVFLTAAAASAADPAVVCHSGKLKVAGKYGACRLNAESKGTKTASTPDYSKCEDKFSSKWLDAETKAGPGVCPSEGDAGSIGPRIIDYADALATLIAGGSLLECQQFPASGQTTSYGPGDDGDVEAGATLAYVDNGDGTITDDSTGLMWEKKVGGVGGYNYCASETATCANPHHASNLYTWSAISPNYDGRAVTIFLNQLNNRCNNDTTVACTVDVDCTVPGGACGFAGHRDWRLPNIKELAALADYGRINPAIDPAFDGASCGLLCTDITDPACSCTQSGNYWSSTAHQDGPSLAWLVYFSDGDPNATSKTILYYARAVRAGS